MTFSPGDRLLRKEDAAALLAVSRLTVDRLIMRGDLIHVRIGTRGIRIPESAVRALIECRTECRGGAAIMTLMLASVVIRRAKYSVDSRRCVYRTRGRVPG